MTDHELRDLLHERVADLSTADLSGAAWARATRIRRRRAAGVVAGAVASVAVVAVALAESRVRPGERTGAGHEAALARPGRIEGRARTGPSPGCCGHAAGRALPRLAGVLGAVGFPGGDAAPGRVAVPGRGGPLRPRARPRRRPDRPCPRGLRPRRRGRRPPAAAARARRLVAQRRRVRVAPFDDGSGFDFSLAHETLLSPTGEHLAFPQRTSVLVLTLATGRWRTIDAGDTTTAGIHWLGNTDIWLPPTTQGGEGPLFSALTGQRSGATNMRAPRGPFDAGGPYGRWRMGPGGEAQSWTRVPGLPVPRGAVTPSQVLLDSGNGPASRALLVYGSSSSSPDAVRPETCCGVQFWLEDDTVAYETYAGPHRLVAWKVGTHGLGLVTRSWGTTRTGRPWSRATRGSGTG